MFRKESPEAYYDEVERRIEENVWWKIVLRYITSVALFVLFIIIALAGYWTWMDFAPGGFKDLSVENWLARAVFRWEEFRQGRIHIEL